MSKKVPVPIEEVETEPEPLTIIPDDIENNVKFIHELGEKDGVFSAPINIDVTGTTKIDLPLLEWYNIDVLPRKMQLTNTGKTVILSSKYPGERPYLNGGPLQGDYVMNQIHFHWGATAVDGSEHTIDKDHQPLEMHAIFFKRSYNNQNEAKVHPDGVICLCYLFQIRSQHSEYIHPIVSALHNIRQADTNVVIQPFVLSRLLYPFEYDYYMYWGKCGASAVMWLISRHTPSLSFEQLCLFRQLMDDRLRPIVRNWREINERHGRLLLHVDPAFEFTNSTLAPVPLRLDCSREMLCVKYDTEKICHLRKEKWFRKVEHEMENKYDEEIFKCDAADE